MPISDIAAQQNHKEACFALTAWYLVGSPGVLPQSDTEAYLWAKKAAEAGLAKAEYAVGYFTEVIRYPFKLKSRSLKTLIDFSFSLG
jgi:TPR repeat protein